MPDAFPSMSPGEHPVIVNWGLTPDHDAGAGMFARSTSAHSTLTRGDLLGDFFRSERHRA
jgi:hypothetical protein